MTSPDHSFLWPSQDKSATQMLHLKCSVWLKMCKCFRHDRQLAKVSKIQKNLNEPCTSHCLHIKFCIILRERGNSVEKSKFCSSAQNSGARGKLWALLKIVVPCVERPCRPLLETWVTTSRHSESANLYWGWKIQKKINLCMHISASLLTTDWLSY